MVIVSYGEGPMKYDMSACCSQCGFRHVARYPAGTPVNRKAACPQCGIGGTTVYGSTMVAALWLLETTKLRCVQCGGVVGRPTDMFCDDCWKSLFLYAVIRSEPAVSPLQKLFEGLPPPSIDEGYEPPKKPRKRRPNKSGGEGEEVNA